LCHTKDTICFHEMAFTLEGAHVKCCVIAKTLLLKKNDIVFDS